MKEFYWIKLNVLFPKFLLSLSFFLAFHPLPPPPLPHTDTYLKLIENLLGDRTILDTGDTEAVRQRLCSQDLYFRGGYSPLPIF